MVFFFNDTATTEIYTLSLHDALPISPKSVTTLSFRWACGDNDLLSFIVLRSEEHTSELQSRQYLVCRLLLEKKNRTILRLSPLLPRIFLSPYSPPFTLSFFLQLPLSV